MLTSRCFRIDWWSPLIKIFIQSILCCFINMEVQMLQSQILCHTFICLSQPRPLQNVPTGSTGHAQGIGIIYVDFLTVPLYIQWDQLIIVQVTLPKPYHQVSTNFILDFKSICLNLINMLTLLTLKAVLGYHPTIKG